MTEYIEAAMKHAQIVPHEYEGWLGTIPPCRGVWATGKTIDECRAELQSVLEGWMIVGLWLHDDFPEIDGITIQTPGNTPPRV